MVDRADYLTIEHDAISRIPEALTTEQLRAAVRFLRQKLEAAEGKVRTLTETIAETDIWLRDAELAIINAPVGMLNYRRAQADLANRLRPRLTAALANKETT